MKVIVRCANNRVTKADMEREIERLFQENKDLRVQAGHLHDELANAKANAEIQRVFRDEMAEKIEALEKELIKSESESSQGMNAMVKFWEEAINEKNKAEERAEEYRIALMESDARVDELKAQKEADDKKSEEICTACNERYEEVLSDRNRLREEVALLTHERDTAVHENTEMMFYIDDLQEDHKELEANFSELEQVHKLWGEEIDRLRRTIVELQTNRFTADEFIGMIMKNFVPSTDK